MIMIHADLTSIALCWRVQRRDGLCLGFTSHDRELVIDHLRYRAAPGMLPSAIRLTDGFEAHTLDVAGALSSDAITEEDLSTGRWDGATVSIFMVDWENPAGAQIPLARGVLGDVSALGNGFSAELRGPSALLDRPVSEQTSPECRAELGDRRCRVDMADRRRLTRIMSVPAEDVVEVAEASVQPNAYGYGRLRWVGGRNGGLESTVLSSEGTRLTLREPSAYPPRPGELVEIIEGCDRSFATCGARFANTANFRGEPHLPGMDLLTRYPGA